MKKTATLGLRLDECTVDRLEELAIEVGLKASTIARLAIERFIADARFRGSLSLPVASHDDVGGAETDDLRAGSGHAAAARDSKAPLPPHAARAAATHPRTAPAAPAKDYRPLPPKGPKQ